MAVATRAAFTGAIAVATPRPPLWPTLSLVGTKDAGNPTFAFSAIPESIVKVGSTYWCVYQGNWGATDDIRLASSSDRDGPWSAYGSNPIWEFSDVSWAPAGADSIYAPYLLDLDGTFYLFYSICKESDGTAGHVGYATASAVTGPYTDHGSAILSPATGWTSRRVGEPAAVYRDGLWVVAAMGESTVGAYGTSEKVGIWTGASLDALTPAAGNPLIDYGAEGEWDDDLTADPHLVYANGYWWCMYAGGGSVGGTGTRKWHQGLAYATDPEGPWTKHDSNPVLSAGSSGWDEMAAWRGGLWVEDGEVGGVYGGLNSDLTVVRGGNFRLDVS